MRAETMVACLVVMMVVVSVDQKAAVMAVH